MNPIEEVKLEGAGRKRRRREGGREKEEVLIELLQGRVGYCSAPDQS